jgi:iron complex outermembrane receptor protein
MEPSALMLSALLRAGYTSGGKNMKKSVFLSSTAVICAALCLPASAMAQQADTKDTAATDAKAKAKSEAEGIVVVGSRLRRNSFDSAAPIQVFQITEEADKGKATAAQVLQGNAITGGNAQVTASYGGYIVDGGPGTSTLGLRGLGATRTLILLNGRRVSPAGVQGGVDAVDLNTLPANLITDRIEVLRDGASSIYGSDAIAGVVNIVTRKKLNGFEVEMAGAIGDNGSAGAKTISVAGGHVGSRFSIQGAFSYAKQDSLLLKDESWAQCQTDGLRFGNSAIDPQTGKEKCYAITGTGSSGVTINTLGTTTTSGVGAKGNAATGNFNRWRANSAVTTGLVGYEGVSGSFAVRDTFDPRMLNQEIISPQEVYNGYVQGSYDLQALGNAELYFSVMVQDRESTQQSYRQLILDYAKGSPLIPANLAFSTYYGAAGSSAMNPTTGTGVRGFVGFGMTENRQSLQYYRYDGGIKGQTGLGDWRYDLYVGAAHSFGKYYTQQFLTSRMAQSAYVTANGTGGYNCTDMSNGCVAMPALTPSVLAGNLPQDWVNFVTANVLGTTVFDYQTVSLQTDGTLLRLPAGPVKTAFTVDYSFSKINDTPGADSVNGNLYNYSTSAFTRGSDSVVSAAGELEVPLLHEKPMFKDLTFNASGRFTHYRSYGDGWTYKVNGKYAPVSWLSLRATYGTSFRAPALKEQFQGAVAGFQNQSGDPCNAYGSNTNPTVVKNCASEGLPTNWNQNSSIKVNTKGGAAAGLKAETSTNFTAGLVLQPKTTESFGSLRFSIDYYDIKIENAVDRAGYSYILSNCYNDPKFGTSASQYCRLVTRNASNGALTVDDSYINIASQETRGLDFILAYKRKFGAVELLVDAIASRYLSQKYQQFVGQDYTEYNGTLRFPKWTGEIDTRLKYDKFTFGYYLSFVSEMDSNSYLGLDGATTPYNFTTPNYFTHGVSLKGKFKKFDATIGVSNLLDTAPPSISEGYYSRLGNAMLYSGYDLFGRRVYADIKAKF